MGKATEQEGRCVRCDATLTDINSNDPLVCSKCGPSARHFSLTINETVVARSTVGLKALHGGSGKPFFLLKSGASFFRNAEVWCEREIIVDRENDRYKETVINPETGEIVHFCDEPLSQHHGHGSAKDKRRL